MTSAEQSAASAGGEPGLAEGADLASPGGRPAANLASAAAPALFALLAIGLIVQDQGGYFPTSFGWSTLGLLGALTTWVLAGGMTDSGRRDTFFFLALVALTAWVGLSIIWSIDPAQSVLELERWLVLVAGCAAFLVLAQRNAVRLTGLGILVAITAVCGYSLSTRLFPSAGTFDPQNVVAGYRLNDPVGYWNALGAFAVVGILLALTYLTEPGSGRIARFISAIALTILPLTVYFTFSRGSWLALGGGLLVVIVAAQHRLRFVTEGAVFALAPVLAVVLGSHSRALVDEKASLAAAVHQGHTLALLTTLIALGAGAGTLVAASLEARLVVTPRLRRFYGGALIAVVAVALVALLIRGGGPISIVRKGYDSFAATTPPTQTANLNSRLFTVNGNGRALLWSVALSSFDTRWFAGTGAGGFEREWDRSPKADEVVRDAHGLYVETLSELGIVGLLLLVIMLGLPLIAGIRRRRDPLVPGFLAGYTAFLIHNAIDWDWELSGVALTGLLLGCLLLVSARDAPLRRVSGRLRVVGGLGSVAVAGFALVAVVGNGALARAQSANLAKNYVTAAADASLARTWMPWSSEPLKALGEARLEQGDVAGARQAFLKAISIDGGDWQGWLDLAATEKKDGYAVARAKALYPTSPEVAEFESATSQ